MFFSDSNEKKIFLTMFILFIYFISWGGDLSDSRFAITKSITDDNTINIDNYYREISDRAFHNEHYYSDKAPGGSFLALPPYYAWKLIYNFFPEKFKEDNKGSEDSIVEQTINGNDIIEKIDPGFFILTAMILVTISTSSLFSAFTIVLIYRISKYFLKSDKEKILVVIIFGGGTLLFHYGLTFTVEPIETFLGFFSFYLLLKMKMEKKYNKKIILSSGILSGLAFLSGFPALLIAAANFFYLAKIKTNKLHIFTLGIILGILPMLIYNTVAFENPLSMAATNMDPSIVRSESIEIAEGNYFPFLPNPMIILQILILPYVGMLFYYPILIFAIVGLKRMYRKYKTESLLIGFTFILFLIFFSSFIDWWHGGVFGFRHILPIYPFLALPLIYWMKTNKNKLGIIFFTLLIFSIFHNFIGLSSTYGDPLRSTGEIQENFIDDVRKGTVNENQLYTKYISDVMKFGTRSKLFESLINGEYEIDIRPSTPSKGNLFPLIYGFHLPFLSLIPLVLIILFLWYDKKYIFFKKYKRTLILLLIIMFLLSFTNIDQDKIKIGKGWYPKQSHEDYIWLYGNGTLIINSNVDEDVRITHALKNFHGNNDLKIFHNDILIENVEVDEIGKQYSTIISLRKGENFIKFDAVNCYIPSKISNSTDTRCLNLQYSGSTIEKFSEGDIKFIINKNWYPISGGDKVNWMYNNGTIRIINEFYEETLSISFSLESYINGYIEIYANGNFISEEKIDLNGKNINFIFNSSKKENTILLYSKEKCKVLGSILGNDDERCITVGIKHITIS